MNSNGWIKIYRKLINSQVFQNEGLLKVWIWCLCKANHEGKWFSAVAGKGVAEVRVEPGQFIFGRKTAAEALRMSQSTIWKRIKKLENMQNLNIESNSHYSLVTIVNWQTYQGDEKKGDSQGDSQGTTKEQLRNTNKNVKNEKKIADSRISALISFFHDQCLSLKGFKPRVNGAGAKAVQEALKDMSEAEVQEAILSYLRSKKADDCGVTLTAALSTHSLNMFQQQRGKSDWQTIA